MSPSFHHHSGLTLIELMVVVATLAAVTGMGLVAVNGYREDAQAKKVRADVETLNNAIGLYLTSGGEISETDGADDVLAKLKTRADTDSSGKLLGFTGPFVDLRMQIERVPEGEGVPPLGIEYSPGTKLFSVAPGRVGGIAGFYRGAESPLVAEARTRLIDQSTQGPWVWDYAAAPAAAQTTVRSPTGVDVASATTFGGYDRTKLQPSLYDWNGTTYEGGVFRSTNFKTDFETATLAFANPLVVPGAVVEYSTNRGTNWLAYSNALQNLDPDPFLEFWTRTRMTNTNSPFTNSDVRSFALALDKLEPLRIGWGVNWTNASADNSTTQPPSLMTYRQANETAPLIVRLLNSIDTMPIRYFNDRYFNLRYTKDGTDPASSPTASGSGAFSGVPPSVSIPIRPVDWGTNSSLQIRAVAKSLATNIFQNSDEKSAEISITPTDLPVEILPLKPIGLPLSVTITVSGDYPTGSRLFYTRSIGSVGPNPLAPPEGGIPTTNALIYTSPLPSTSFPAATYTIVAQATGPTNREHWFLSAAKNRTYIAITTVPLKYVGLNMFRANINGYVKGSIYMQAGDFAVLNAGATIEGNVYLPGTPSVFLPASGALIVRERQAYDQSKDALISPDRITGREYTTDGTVADPQTDLRKIVDLYGSTDPSNYQFRGTETSRIDGKLYRRADPPPVTSQKPGLPSEIALSNAPVTVSGTNALASGSYAVTLNNSNSVLRLGSVGDLTKYVFGAGSTWSVGRVEILGPVQIFFNSNVSMSGITFGTSNSIYQTGFVVMSNYSVSIGGGSTIYGQFEARDSVLSVGNDGAFYGSAFALEVSVAGRGYVDVSGGSDTNSL